MTWTWMSRIDPDKNANRWYLIGIQPSLFDPIALIRFWGSRTTTYQQVMVQPFDDQETAREAADKLICDKVRSGYRVTAGYRPPGIEGLETSRELVAEVEEVTENAPCP